MVLRNIPLSRQIAQELYSGIENGSLVRDNGMLPSEAELSQRYAVSRATIREALSQLEQRGAVIRRHGVGTFVAPPLPRIDAGLEKLESLETMARRIGLETHMGNPHIEERPALPAEAESLQVPLAAPVLSISRVIMTGSQPIAFLVDVVPTTVLHREDLAQSFSGSVLDLLIRRGDPLSHSRTDIRIEGAAEPIAYALHVQPGEPLLKLQAQLFTPGGRVIDYSQSYFVPGYFRFHVIRRVDDCTGESS